MARTKTTGEAAPSFMPAAGGGVLIKFCEDEEVRIENRKIKVPVPLKETESDTERTTSFYTCSGKLDTETSHISAVARITHLADHANTSMVLTYSLKKLMNCYGDQLVDPSKWTIRTFHDPTGQVFVNTVSDADPQMLKPTGDDQNNTAAANCRAADVQYVSVSIQVDFSSMTEDRDDKVELNTVVKLPMENKTIKDGNGNDIVVYTFQGNNDIHITPWNNEPQPGRPAAFGYTQAILESVKTDAEFRESVVEGCMAWLTQQLFDFYAQGWLTALNKPCSPSSRSFRTAMVMKLV